MMWLVNLLTSGAVKVLGESLVKPVLDLVAKKQDINLEKYRVDSTVGIEILKAEIETAKLRKEMNVLAMSHPVWWWAWALFVFPVGLYHASIFFVSTFPHWGWAIERVPPVQEEWANAIVGFIFLCQVGSGIAGALINRFLGRRG